jgi:hypothetical protein
LITMDLGSLKEHLIHPYDGTPTSLSPTTQESPGPTGRGSLV